jgi:hypothetical protein
MIIRRPDISVVEALLTDTFQWEHFLEYGVDKYFVARVINLDESETLDTPSKYWKQIDHKSPFEGALILPRDKQGVAIYTRRAFKYPILNVYAKLPSLSLVGDETYIFFWLGFEQGSGFYNGIFALNLVTTTTDTNRLRLVAGPRPSHTYIVADAVKPGDFDTEYHNYRFVVAKNLCLFFIDKALRGVVVQALQGDVITVKLNVPPYVVAITPPLPSRLTALLELITNRGTEAPADVIAPISPYSFRLAEGKEIIPLDLDLYLEDSDTRLRGYSISSGTVVSHPIPTWGYEKKVLYFMADQAGTLEIQTYHLSRSWRTYDSISVSANTLLRYRIEDPAVLARVVFTPSTYPATILEAEAQMQ